jgi:hypothetical protein
MPGTSENGTIRKYAECRLWGNNRTLKQLPITRSRSLRAAWTHVFLCLFAAISCVGRWYGISLLMIMGPISDQDLGEYIDLLHHAVDLAVFRTADRDVGQRPREEMAGSALQVPYSLKPMTEVTIPTRCEGPSGGFRLAGAGVARRDTNSSARNRRTALRRGVRSSAPDYCVAGVRSRHGVIAGCTVERSHWYRPWIVPASPLSADERVH